MMRKLFSLLVVLILVFGLGGTAAAAAPTTVYLVNTIPRIVLDVYADGNLIIEDFAPESILGPFVGQSINEVRIDMIPANTVLGEDNGFLSNAVLVTRLAAGATVAIVAQPDNIPGSLGSLKVVTYDFSATGPGHSNLMIYNALIDDSIEIVLFPGTANEQHLPFIGATGVGHIRLPAGPKTASVFLWGRAPLPEVIGPFTADLKPGKLYVVFVYRKLGAGVQMLRQEFNVGQ